MQAKPHKYSIDMGATALEWAGLDVPQVWDGKSFAGDFLSGKSRALRESLVLSRNSGPFHLRDAGPDYIQRLRERGRADWAERFAQRDQPVG